jgi:hypothetical protein
VVEEATGTRLLTNPRHTVTKSLLAASGRDGLFADEPARPVHVEKAAAPVGAA